MKDYLKIIIGASIIIATIVASIMCVVVNNKYKKFVFSHSEKIRKLLLLNKQTKFYESVKSEYYFSRALKSKRKLENTSIYDFFIKLIEDNYDSFNSIINTIKYNILSFNTYKDKFNSIKSSATEEFCKQLKTKYKKFVRREEALSKTLFLKPVVDTKITVELTYTSPQGRNFYNKCDVFNFNNLVDMFNRTTTLIKSKQARQYLIQIERAKMSDSLRYDIFKRDNFRCQICGATADDGVKLHVDHITPVSKGGKTEYSNLRTLCDRCNMGKADKIE